MRLPHWLYCLASPPKCYALLGRWLPWLALICGVLLVYGLVGGLILAPADYQQGDGFRIIYVHVPSAFLSLMVYTVMALSSIIYYVWHIRLADMVAISSAKIGAWFTFLALVTGSIWGKPMWGTWWVWDARLTSELILLFLYIGFIALYHAIDDADNAGKVAGLLAIVGLINLPIIHYSVYWWSTLHQGATLARFAKPSISSSMLYPLLAMIAAFVLFYACVLIMRVRCELLQRSYRSDWVQRLQECQ